VETDPDAEKLNFGLAAVRTVYSAVQFVTLQKNISFIKCFLVLFCRAMVFFIFHFSFFVFYFLF
jgi:hypothetical protein